MIPPDRHEGATGEHVKTVRRSECVEILFVTPLPPPGGGIATWSELVLRETVSRADFSVRVVDTAVRWREVHDLRLVPKLTAGVVAALGQILRCALAVLRKRPTAVHICSSGGLAVVRDTCVLLLCALVGSTSVYHLHNGRIPDVAAAGGVGWRLFLLAVSLADFTVVLDTESRRIVERARPNSRVRQVPNCIDSNSIGAARAGRCEKAPVQVVFAGSVKRAKGVVDLLEACIELRGLFDFRLHVAGTVDPAIGPDLATYCEAMTGRLTLHGELPHQALLELMAHSDVFVLPSYSEGFPYVVLEAMACCLPVVATDVGAISEMIDGGPLACGICVPPGDVAALATALARLLTDAELRSSLGRNGRARVENRYSLSEVFERLAELWRAGLRGR